MIDIAIPSDSNIKKKEYKKLKKYQVLRKYLDKMGEGNSGSHSNRSTLGSYPQTGRAAPEHPRSDTRDICSEESSFRDSKDTFKLQLYYERHQFHDEFVLA